MKMGRGRRRVFPYNEPVAAGMEAPVRTQDKFRMDAGKRHSEIKPRRRPDFVSLYGPGEGVWALMKREWEAAVRFKQESNRVRLALNRDHIWHRGMRSPPSSSVRFCVYTIASTSPRKCCLFPFKTLETRMKWVLFVSRTGYITAFVAICFSQ